MNESMAVMTRICSTDRRECEVRVKIERILENLVCAVIIELETETFNYWLARVDSKFRVMLRLNLKWR